MKRGFMRRLLCALVRAYQLFLSPLLPRTCRFYPSCSEYMIQAITEYGAWRGLGKGLWRLLRCQPFAKGGHDPVTPKGEFKIQNAKWPVRMTLHAGRLTPDAGCVERVASGVERYASSAVRVRR